MEPHLDAQYDDPFFVERRAVVVERMVAGGYWDKVMSAGADLDRVKEFLLIMAGRKPPVKVFDNQRPRMLPVFPGLSHRPFHDPTRYPWVRAIEAAYPAIRREMEALEASPSYIEYSPEIKVQGTWEAFPFYFMGLRIPHTAQACPETVGLLERLDRCCCRYPWADMLFSKHSPGTHLRPHYSIDALRLRCHLGLVVPKGSTIRVGSEERPWKEGKALLFEDSFEHETWNRGDSSRVVLIVDFWHPDFTAAEIRALSAGFRKAEVRASIYDIRFQGSDEMKQGFLQAFAAEDQDAAIGEFWG